MGEAVRWYEGPDGFYRKRAVEPLAITAASLGIDYEEADGSSTDGNMIRHSDEPFWRQEAARRHIEIDL